MRVLCINPGHSRDWFSVRLVLFLFTRRHYVSGPVYGEECTATNIINDGPKGGTFYFLQGYPPEFAYDANLFIPLSEEKETRESKPETEIIKGENNDRISRTGDRKGKDRPATCPSSR